MRRLSLIVAFALLTAAACGGATEKTGYRNDVPTAGTANDPPSSAGAANDLPGSAGSGSAGNDHGSAGSSGRGGAGDGRAGAGGLGGDCALCGEPAPTIVGEPGSYSAAWKDSWFLTGCRSTENGYRQTFAGACPASGGRTKQAFPVNGTPGQRYKVTFTFNAVVEAKAYVGGKRDAGSSPPDLEAAVPADTFLRDGTPSESDHNSWKLTVFDERGMEARHYYLNSFPEGRGFEAGRTFLVSFSKSIVIIGGGKLTHEVADVDCQAVDNCGPGINDTSCPAPRNLPNDPAPLFPAMYEDPEDHQIKPPSQLSAFNAAESQPWHSQVGHLTVQSIEPTTDLVSIDYL